MPTNYRNYSVFFFPSGKMEKFSHLAKNRWENFKIFPLGKRGGEIAGKILLGNGRLKEGRPRPRDAEPPANRAMC